MPARVWIPASLFLSCITCPWIFPCSPSSSSGAAVCFLMRVHLQARFDWWQFQSFKATKQFWLPTLRGSACSGKTMYRSLYQKPRNCPKTFLGISLACTSVPHELVALHCARDGACLTGLPRSCSWMMLMRQAAEQQGKGAGSRCKESGRCRKRPLREDSQRAREGLRGCSPRAAA